MFILYFIATTLLSPFLLIYWGFNKEKRGEIGERLGFGGWNFFINRKKKDVIWFHAASVGELNGIKSLIYKVKTNNPILITVTSSAARLIAREISEHSYFLPIDHPLFIGRIHKLVNPKAIIITETELWPAFIKAAKAPIILVNARISDKTLPRYKKLSFLLRSILNKFTLILTQTERDRERFLLLGSAQEKTKFIGNTKYDQVLKSPDEEINKKFSSKNIITFASIRDDEYQQIIEYISKFNLESNYQYIIAPRHKQYFSDVYTYAKSKGLSTIKWSEAKNSQHLLTSNWNIFIIDTIGDLISFYPISKIVFVGGTLNNTGGHNILEPAQFNLPILFGPSFSNYLEPGNDLLSSENAKIVDSYESFKEAVIFFENKQKINSVEVFNKYLGATKEVLNELKKYLALDKSS